MNKLKIYFTLVFLIAVSLNGFSQFNAPEDMKEAKEMLAICNSFTFLDLYNSDREIIPEGYKKTYTSGTLGMDNKYQIYQTEKTAVINLRGSTAKKISWMENIYSSMISANGFIVLPEDTFFYKFASDTAANVHAGYTLGVAFLAKGLISAIKSLNYDGIYNITLTGHSQGGSLAILIRAYLENLPKGTIDSRNQFKTFAFAHPKVGNKEFVSNYDSYCEKWSSYSIINPADFIPKMPLSVAEQETNSLQSIASLFFDKSSPSLKEIIGKKLGTIYGNSISNYMKSSSESIHKNISKELGTIEMPPYQSEINYVEMSNRIELNKFEYPKILKDSLALQNESSISSTKKSEEDNSIYKEEPSFFQHKPYNYYVGFLKEFYPIEYEELTIKYLPENL